MHVVTSVMVALLAILVIGCTGEGIAPATSAAPAPVPADSDPLAALYAAPAGAAFIHVSDVAPDSVGPGDLPLEAYAFLGYSFAAAADVVVPVEFHTATATLAPFGYLVDLSLAESDAVPPPVDLDAFFSAAPAASADDEWERAPEMQQPPLVGWEAPPLDAK